MRYELTDLEWSAIKPFLPNKPRGVPRVNDRRALIVALRHATTGLRPTTSPSFSLRQLRCGCALMSPRPGVRLDRLDPSQCMNLVLLEQTRDWFTSQADST
jgi:hypothetical protein